MKALLIGTLILSVLAACNEPFEEKWYEHTEAETRTFDLTGQTHLTLENTNGSIDITGSDAVSHVQCEITKRVRSTTLEDARQHIDDIVITGETRASDVYVKVEHPTSTERNYLVDFVITVPAQFDFQIFCGNGGIELSSTTGDVKLLLGNGEIEFENVTARAACCTVGNGSIEADVTLEDNCAVDFELGNGDIALHIPKGTNAEVDASVGNGQIMFTGLVFSDLSVSRTHLSGILGDGSGHILLSVGNGVIQLLGK